jgi:hypothetical protein
VPPVHGCLIKGARPNWKYWLLIGWTIGKTGSCCDFFYKLLMDISNLPLKIEIWEFKTISYGIIYVMCSIFVKIGYILMCKTARAIYVLLPKIIDKWQDSVALVYLSFHENHLFLANHRNVRSILEDSMYS